MGLIGPWECVACKAPLAPPEASCWESALCGKCLVRVRLLDVACPRCGGPGGVAAKGSGCWECAGTPRGDLASTTALFSYRGPGRSLLAALKYQRRDDLAGPLGRALGERFRQVQPVAAASQRAVVVPVPLHPWRRFRRGFNQAEELAWGVARALRLPVACAARRARATAPLFGVPREERADQVAGAFVARSRALRGRPVLLVDDIRTSGATLREVARALRGAGAPRIDALVVAR